MYPELLFQIQGTIRGEQMMDWLNAAAAFPPLKENDIAGLHLSKEEKEQVLTLFNRAVSNAQSDSADIAMIALKKLLSQYPAWGEAALLYGICLAIDGKYKRAAASFEHAISAGLLTEELTYLAQVCGRDAGLQYAQEHRHAQGEEEAAGRNILSSIFPPRKNRSSVYREIDTEERGHMQAPILTRVPRNAGKAKLASDRERRDVMMQSTAPQSDSQDEEIDVTIPRTPAEKLRIAMIAAGSVFIAVLIGLTIWFLIIPAVRGYQQNSGASVKLQYLLAAMKNQKGDPEVSQIILDYEKEFPPATAVGQTAGTAPVTASPAAQTQTASQSETTVPAQSPPASITPTLPPGTQETSAAASDASQGQTS